MLRNIVGHLYPVVQPYLPYKFAVFNGVPVCRYARLFDLSDEYPDHKETNIEALRDHVEEGDRVVVIGGGYGVTAVVAARQTGTGGTVTVYEASTERVRANRETFRVNKVDDICSVRHAVVGELHKSGGELGEPDQIAPASLPACDVLEIDCEGAETEILANITSRPKAVVVESHPELGAETEEVVDILTDAGYEITETYPDPVDGHVLTARHGADPLGEARPEETVAVS